MGCDMITLLTYKCCQLIRNNILVSYFFFELNR